MKLDPRFDKRKHAHLRLGLLNLIKHLPKNCIMVELGSYSGDSAVLFAAHAQRLYCVDPWDRLDLSIVSSVKQRKSLEELPFDKVEQHFDYKMREFKNVEKLKLFSDEAVLRFKDASLNFVYIDALHTYDDVKRDIALWLPKIRLNGYIGGHDYNVRWPGVKQAVDEAFGKPHFIFEDHSWLVRL